MKTIQSVTVSKAASYGAVSGVLLALFINFLFNFEFETFKKKAKRKLENEIVLQRILVLIILIVLLPTVLAFVVVAYFYKILCSIIIKRKDKHFAGFLDSFDVFWSLEDDSTKSIINVLGVVESNSSEELIEHIKERLQSIVQNSHCEKLFYRRNEEFGFYYWRKCCYIDISQYVRIIDVANTTDLNKSDLEEIMTEISYQPLPFNDEGLFQVLITNQKIQSRNGTIEFGVIFRIHHAAGDGVALIEFLCQTLADNKENDSNMFCMPVTYPVDSKKTSNNLLNMIRTLCEMPMCLVEGILREPDKSTLHGPALTGRKFFKWTETDNNLFRLVREIKDNSGEFNFSDILAAALACGLREYFLKGVDPAPNNVAVILPIRFPRAKNGDLKLENNFTVSIFDLPIGTDIYDIKERFNKLRESADPLTNHHLLKICSVLPKDILYPMFNSSQATMVLSNMPGPKLLSICGGDLKSLVFFVPNKGNTGLGVTALCYDGILRFGAMADSAIVSNSNELSIILDVKGMEKIKSRSCSFIMIY
ncbi:unnamed protein product, partial [Brenthis ino]